jgi:hypothetical protein
VRGVDKARGMEVEQASGYPGAGEERRGRLWLGRMYLAGQFKGDGPGDGENGRLGAEAPVAWGKEGDSAGAVVRNCHL